MIIIETSVLLIDSLVVALGSLAKQLGVEVSVVYCICSQLSPEVFKLTMPLLRRHVHILWYAASNV